MVDSDGQGGGAARTGAVERRDLLGLGAGGLAALLAGCSVRSSSQRGTPTTSSGTPGTDTGGADDGTRSGGSDSTEASTSDALLLPSLDVGGSPGGLVALEPTGTATLLDFFATWCAPCIPEMDHLRAVRERYAAQDVAIVSITQERDESAVESFWREHEGTWPVVLDPGARAARHYGATTIPTILVLAPDGTVVDQFTGLVREPRLAGALDAALARDDG